MGIGPQALRAYVFEIKLLLESKKEIKKPLDILLEYGIIYPAS
jgi:hypothetical protein